MKKALRHLPTIVFLLFIYVMAILFFVLPKSKYSSSEKRYLAEFPKLTTDSFFSGDFGTDFEKYLSDHTAGRNLWVGMSSYYNYTLGNPLSNGIYHCKDGYLINDPPQTDRYELNIDIIAEFKELNPDINVTAVLAPSTGYVVDDVLPNKHINYTDDELFAYAQDTFDEYGVNFVDIRKTLKDAYKNGTQVYYRTDHHWTAKGAYLAYCNLSSSLGYTPNKEGDYTVTTHPDFYGTTYSSSGFWFTKPDDIEIWRSNKHKDFTVQITEGNNTTESDSMFYPERLKDDDKYPVYLDGNHAYTTITNNALKNSGVEKKLLVIKDSFAHTLVPFLAGHYSEIVMVDLRYYKEPVSQLLKQTSFDNVLFMYSIDNISTDVDLAFLE